eukprot:1133339-Amphidinium_carterae.1
MFFHGSQLVYWGRPRYVSFVIDVDYLAGIFIVSDQSPNLFGLDLPDLCSPDGIPFSIDFHKNIGPMRDVMIPSQEHTNSSFP